MRLWFLLFPLTHFSPINAAAVNPIALFDLVPLPVASAAASIVEEQVKEEKAKNPGVPSPSEWEQAIKQFRKDGLCTKYADRSQEHREMGLSLCDAKCGNLSETVEETGQTKAVTCYGPGPDDPTIPNYPDLKGDRYSIAECHCDDPIIILLVDTVAIALPAIAYIGCNLLFAAFQPVLEAGLNLLPGGPALSAGLRAGIQGAKTIAEYGGDAGVFGSWFSGVCGSKPEYPDYTKTDFEKLFNPMSLVDSGVVPILPCPKGKCPPKGKKGGDRGKLEGDNQDTRQDQPPNTIEATKDGITQSTQVSSENNPQATESTNTALACRLHKRANVDESCDVNGHIHTTTTTKIVTTLTTPPITCKSTWGQACYHYSSVMSVHSKTADMVRWTCNDGTSRSFKGAATAAYGSKDTKKQHNWEWLEGWTEAQAKHPTEDLGLACNRDEWPPINFWPKDKENKPGQRVRYLPGEQNKGAGSMWVDVCGKNGEFDSGGEKNSDLYKTIQSKTRVIKKGGSVTTISSVKVEVPQPVFEIKHWEHNADGRTDDGLEINPCWPKAFVPDDPGFALLTDDEWYNKKIQAQTVGNYANPPSQQVLQGKRKPLGLLDWGEEWGGLENMMFDEAALVGAEAEARIKRQERRGGDPNDDDFRPSGARVKARRMNVRQMQSTPTPLQQFEVPIQASVKRKAVTVDLPPPTAVPSHE